jgi:hypothetical protein
MGLVLACNAWAADKPAPSVAGLCLASETTYFSCAVARGRWIGLCGVAPAALQYRYGKPSAIELRYPEAASEGVRRMRYAHYFRYQTDRVELSFEHDGARYALFDNEEEGKRHAGVSVTTSGGQEQEIACRGRVTSRLAELETVVPCDADSALNMGSCP